MKNKATKLSLVGIVAAGLGLGGCNTERTPYFARPQGIAGIVLESNAYLNENLTPQQATVMGLGGRIMQQDAIMEVQAEDAEKAAQAGADNFTFINNPTYSTSNPNNGNNVSNANNVNRVVNVVPFEIGKTYRTSYLEWSDDSGKIWNKEGKFRGFGRVDRGKGWEVAYEFDTKDGKVCRIILPYLISSKPID